MAYEIIGKKRKKVYKIPFLTSDGKHGRTIRFTNYGKYNRREALKKVLNLSYLRHMQDIEDDLERTDENSTVKNYMIVTQSSYGAMIDAAIRSVDRVDIRGKNDPRPKTLILNPYTFGLMFKDHYKYDNKNPPGRFLGRLGKYDEYWKGRRLFREKVEREKQKILSEKDNRKPPDEKIDEKIFRDKEGTVIPAFRTNDLGELLQYATDDVIDLNPFWETAADSSNSP